MDTIKSLASNPAFWQGAFAFGVVLLILSHKISLEGLIE